VPGTSSNPLYNSSGAVGASTGLKLGASTITATKDAVTAVSTDTTLGDHNIVIVTVGSSTDKTMTLPAASTTTVGHYRVYVADTGTKGIIIAPNGSDTLNGVNAATAALTGQFQGYDITWVSTTGWRVEYAVTVTVAGSATGKKVLCIDPTTYKLYISSTAVDCSN
jgi:hypothetical protein